jgi:hypothetical protein
MMSTGAGVEQVRRLDAYDQWAEQNRQQKEAEARAPLITSDNSSDNAQEEPENEYFHRASFLYAQRRKSPTGKTERSDAFACPSEFALLCLIQYYQHEPNLVHLYKQID